MSMILANVLWMKKYEGDRHTLRNGASNLDEADHLIENSGEVHNFSEGGFCRSYIALNAGGRWSPNIDLSRIDSAVSKDNEMIKGIIVVWTAPIPVTVAAEW